MIVRARGCNFRQSSSDEMASESWIGRQGSGPLSEYVASPAANPENGDKDGQEHVAAYHTTVLSLEDSLEPSVVIKMQKCSLPQELMVITRHSARQYYMLYSKAVCVER